MAKAIKSVSPVFVDMKTLEARAKANGYTRSRRYLNDCRLLNGNYLTVAVSQLHGSPQFGQRYAVRLVETTNGRFYQKNGKNVVEIHDEVEVTAWYNGKDKTTKWVERFEAQIDIMLEFDRQRLSNGHYLTIVENAQNREVTVVEAEGVDFKEGGCTNVVTIHATFCTVKDRMNALGHARTVHARIFAEDARAAIRSKAA
ncbi:hypothetical protein [Acetobacter sp.]|uniref:hypothetical protein n=1 Tax=Acetobacter sp. TaxID=440 RepID=UPI0039EC003B